MKRIYVTYACMFAAVVMSNVAYGYTFGFTNLMAGPANVRVKLSGINEPWYTQHLRGAKEPGPKGKSYEFEFQVDAPVPSDMKRKFGFCLSQIQVQPYVYNEMAGKWENSGYWYDIDPRFIESNSFNKMMSAVSKFNDGLKDSAATIVKGMSKGVKGVKKIIPQEEAEPELLEVDASAQQEIAQKDLYAVLGVPKNASSEQIRAAYKKQALQWHPDRNKGNEGEAAEKFKEIVEAYDILNKNRTQYDGGTFSLAGSQPKALIKDAYDDWHMVAVDKVTPAEKARSTMQSFKKGTKLAAEVIESVPLGNIVSSLGGIIKYSLCKDRHFHVLPNIDTEGDEVPGPIVTTNAR